MRRGSGAWAPSSATGAARASQPRARVLTPARSGGARARRRADALVPAARDVLDEALGRALVDLAAELERAARELVAAAIQRGEQRLARLHVGEQLRVGLGVLAQHAEVVVVA